MINRITLLLFIGLAFWGCEEKTGVDGEDMSCINVDEQNRILCEIGYNSIRTDAPIHYHFADSLPSNYSGTDSNWIWEDWISTSESLIKNELFPILGAYEHHYFLIDYEGFDPLNKSSNFRKPVQGKHKTTSYHKQNRQSKSTNTFSSLGGILPFVMARRHAEEKVEDKVEA
mgnify:CR=1 FL=1